MRIKLPDQPSIVIVAVLLGGVQLFGMANAARYLLTKSETPDVGSETLGVSQVPTQWPRVRPIGGLEENPTRDGQTTENEEGQASSAASYQDTRSNDNSSAAASYPSHILDLSNWKITLPIDSNGDSRPDEILQPQLASLSVAPYFYREKNGVIFRAHAGGATTRNSSYPRSELREMSGKSLASWSNTSGTHTMIIKQAITNTPGVKPHVVAGQIHDANDDVVMVRLEGNHLFVEADGKSIGSLDTNYTLGRVFTVKIVAANSKIQVYYNDHLKVSYARAGSGYYFKAGCYTQTNTSKGSSADTFGQVVIYSLQVSHN